MFLDNIDWGWSFCGRENVCWIHTFLGKVHHLCMVENNWTAYFPSVRLFMSLHSVHLQMLLMLPPWKLCLQCFGSHPKSWWHKISFGHVHGPCGPRILPEHSRKWLISTMSQNSVEKPGEAVRDSNYLDSAFPTCLVSGLEEHKRAGFQVSLSYTPSPIPICRREAQRITGLPMWYLTS